MINLEHMLNCWNCNSNIVKTVSYPCYGCGVEAPEYTEDGKLITVADKRKGTASKIDHKENTKYLVVSVLVEESKEYILHKTIQTTTNIEIQLKGDAGANIKLSFTNVPSWQVARHESIGKYYCVNKKSQVHKDDQVGRYVDQLIRTKL